MYGFGCGSMEFWKISQPKPRLPQPACSLASRSNTTQAGTHSFTLQLPDTLHSVHPVFHVSMLEPATPNTIPNRNQPPPPPINVEGEPEYEIAAILDAKLDRRRSCKLLYLVRWSGYEGTDEEFSWLPATELGHASELVADFHSAYPDKPGPLPIP